MPGRVYEGDLVVPAGTPITAPVTAVLPIDLGTLAKVTLVVPPGHGGLTGFQLRLSGTPIVPYAGAAWVVANAYTDSWEVDQPVNPGQVILAGYNTDVFPHTFYVRALLTQPTAPGPLGTAPALAGAGGIDLASLQQYPGAQGIPPAAASPPIPGGGGPCYDVDGNQVDCSDPAAVAGPVASPGQAGGPYPAGDFTGPPAPSSPCFDAAGNVVDCTDPAAVTGPVPGPRPATRPAQPLTLPAVPAAHTVPPGPAQGPPGPAVIPAPVITRAQPLIRHTADGRLSLNQAAAALHLPAIDVVLVTRHARQMTARQLAAFNAYAARGLGRPMPRGLVYYTAGRHL